MDKPGSKATQKPGLCLALAFAAFCGSIGYYVGAASSLATVRETMAVADNCYSTLKIAAHQLGIEEP